MLFTACVTLPVITGPEPEPVVAPAVLRAPEDFAKISDATERSKALFTEAGKVLTHARCTNCHPAGESPKQGERGKVHEPPVTRGAGGFGTFLVACLSCHQDKNGIDEPIPGAPMWHLAPAEMTWEGKSVAEICAQLKDPALNGGRALEQVIHHSAHDPLVAWGWNPGPGRAPVPGTQARFGALLLAWAETGAVCP